MDQQKQQWIQTLSKFYQGDLQRAANSPSPQTAIPARILQDPGKFSQNALAGMGNFIKSTLGMPGAVINSVKNGTEAQDLQNLGKAFVNQYKNIAHDPYGSFINDPVNTSLAIAPAGKALDMVAGGAPAPVAPKPPQNWTSEGMRVMNENKLPQISGMNIVQKTPEEIAAVKGPAVDPYDVRKFKSNYIVPAKRAGANDLNTLATSEKILQHVKSGMTIDPNAAPDLVTGDGGLVTKMTRDYYSQIKGSIDLGQPVDAAQTIVKKSAAISKADKANIVQAIKEALPENSADPMDVYDKARELQTLGWEYEKKSTYLTDSMKSKHIGDAYIAAGTNIIDQLDAQAAKDGVIDAVKTPERMAEAKSISPLLHDQLLAAKNGQQLRSTASPFVKLSKMQELDQIQRDSTFGQVAKGMQHGLDVGGTKINAQSLIQQPRNILGQIAANTIDKKLAPMYENFNRQKMANSSNLLPPIGDAAVQLAMDKNVQQGALHIAGNIGKSGIVGNIKTGVNAVNAANASGQEQPQQLPQNAPEPIIPSQSRLNMKQNNTVETNNTRINYTDIPQDVTQIKPNGKGQYPITSPQNIIDKDGMPLALSEDEYANEKAKLQQELGTLPVKYNPKVSAQKEAELAQLETTHTLSQKAQDGYTGAMKASNAVTSTLQTMTNAPVNLFNKINRIEDFNKEYNGKYAQLGQQLQILQKYYPVMVDSVMKAPNTEYAKQILSQISNQIAQDYYQGINNLTGNVPGQATPQQQPTMQPPSPQLSPLGGSAIGGNGGSVQGQPLAAF